MAATPSSMLALGTAAPPFSLPDAVTGRVVSHTDLEGSHGLLVMFICNHCPYVKHVRSVLASLAREYQAKGIGVVGINSNDFTTYPDDSPAKMRDEARAAGYTFPYLVDESQAVARAYQAACTPDFFLFDRTHSLVYRGQLDGSRPGNAVPPSGEDLRTALDAVVAGLPVSPEQKASLGCNIKWKTR